METHAPYNQIPKEYVAGSAPTHLGLHHHFNPPYQSSLRTAYTAAVSYLSDAYQSLFSILNDQMDYVITLGDHGELLGEHNHYGHEYGLYSELTHVPLVISGNSIKDGTESKVVSLLDVHPTVLKWSDVDLDDNCSSLLEPKQNSAYLVEGHGIPSNIKEKHVDEEHQMLAFDKYIRGIKTQQGYAHKTVNGWEVEEGDRSHLLRTRLNELVTNLEETQRSSNQLDLSESAKKRLEANGYL